MTGLHGNAKDLAGRRFGRLVVLHPVFRGKSRYRWLCQCDCGNTKEVSSAHLKRPGKAGVRSCGCLRKEFLISLGKLGILHRNEPRPAEYTAWAQMKDRCSNPKAAGYQNYGGRGITVCPEWRCNFAAFLDHIGPRPSPRHSVDRIDVNGNYEPGNVRWATRLEQASNKRNTKLLDFNGESKTAAAWSRDLGISRHVIERRLKNGATMAQVVSSWYSSQAGRCGEGNDAAAPAAE